MAFEGNPHRGDAVLAMDALGEFGRGFGDTTVRCESFSLVEPGSDRRITGALDQRPLTTRRSDSRNGVEAWMLDALRPGPDFGGGIRGQ